MKSIKELKLEARQQATNRGHLLSTFFKQGETITAVCKRCQKKGEIHNGMLVLQADTVFTVVCS